MECGLGSAMLNTTSSMEMLMAWIKVIYVNHLADVLGVELGEFWKELPEENE
jgi:hypothetical protein